MVSMKLLMNSLDKNANHSILNVMKWQIVDTKNFMN